MFPRERERERVKRGLVKHCLTFVAVAALFLAVYSSIKAQESDIQNGFEQAFYQFLYENQTVPPQHPEIIAENENISDDLYYHCCHLHRSPWPPSRLSFQKFSLQLLN